MDHEALQLPFLQPLEHQSLNKKQEEVNFSKTSTQAHNHNHRIKTYNLWCDWHTGFVRYKVRGWLGGGGELFCSFDFLVPGT